MIIYNVTNSIDPVLHEQWLNWLRETHIPKVLETGNFYKIKIIKVLADQAHGGVTYSVQYFARTMDDLKAYYSNHHEGLGSEARGIFGDRVLQFETELQIVEEFEL